MLLVRLFVFFVLISPVGLWAQEEYDFAKYATSDGLPSNLISHVYADPEGFVWVSTGGGLARFDGQHFVPVNDLLTGAKLPRSTARAIIADNKGKIWVQFAKRGVYCIDLARHQAQPAGDDFLKIDFLLHPAVHQDNQGNIWLLANYGLACLQSGSSVFAFHPFAPDKPASVAAVHTFCPAPDGSLWVVAGTGLYHFNVHTFQWKLLLDLQRDCGHIGIIPDEDGTLWINNWYQQQGGLVHFDPQQKRALQVFSVHPGHPDSIPSTDFQGFYAEKNRLWLATNDQGLVFYDKPTKKFRRFQPNPKDPASFSDMQAQSVTRDIFGNLWVGTSQFLNLAAANPKFVTHLTPEKGLISGNATTAATISPEKVVLGTASGLSIYDWQHRSFQQVNLPLYNQNTYNNFILSVAPCDAASFWLSTWSGIFRLDIRSGRILEYYITNGNAGTAHPAALRYFDVGTAGRICTDGQGNLWLAAHQRMVKLARNGPKAEFVTIEPPFRQDGRHDDEAIAFLPVGERLLYVGTHDGVVRYDVISGELQILPLTFPGLEKKPRVRELAYSKDGTILAIVNDDLFRFDPRHPEQPAIHIPLSYSNFFPTGLEEDDLGNIWLSGEIGLLRIDPARNTSTLYDSRQHLNNNFFSSLHLGIAKDLAGNLYFSGNKGVSVIRPGAIRSGSAPDVKIVGLYVNNAIIALDAPIHQMREIELAHDENNLLFGFSVFNSSIPSLNRFSYMLEGVSNKWVDLNHQNTLNLVNLQPGTYILHLRGANSDGEWGEVVAPLRIVIRSPWWSTWWAWLCYVGIVVAGIMRVYQIRLRRFMLEQNLDAESRERERLAALDAFKSRFFTNISHEFRTPLTVIIGLAERWSAMKTPWVEKDVRHSLSLIQRSGENLLRLIAGILDLAKLENNALKMNYVQGDVLVYLQYITESLHSLAAVRNIALRVECREETIVMDYEPERLLQIVYNLLSNAIKFTPAGGRVTLSLQRVDDQPSPMLQMMVTDTGAGIPEGDLSGVFDRFFQAENQYYAQTGGTGVGLSLTRELVRTMGGTITVASEVGAGTTFTVLLPVTNQAAWEHQAMPQPQSAPAQPGAIIPALPSDASLPQLLLIEDNPDVMEYLVTCLQDSYRLEVAFNGREGVAKALELVPDIIISDVMMPEMDGLEVCDVLKNDERTSHIPMVLLTAKADLESRIAGLRRGADVYLAKPFHQEELKIVLHNLLEQRRKWQERFGALPPLSAPSAAPQEAAPGFEIEHAFLQKLRQQIMDHLDDATFDGPRLAKIMLLSDVQLYRKIKALTGKSTAIYIRSVRLHQAMDLLRNTALNVSEIAYQVGFEDPNYFSRTFSQEFGVAPSDIRK